MAKIKKIQRTVDGVLTTEYPVTIHQAVVDVETDETLDVTLTKKANHGYDSSPKTLKEVEDNASVKIENLAVNGDFNSSSGWAGTNWVVENGVAKNNGSVGILRRSVSPFIAIINTNIYYIAFFTVSDTAELSMTTTSGALLFSGTARKVYSTGYSSIRLTAVNDNLMGIVGGYDSSQPVIDKLRVINLTTTFGAGNEPTKEEMDLLISTLGIDYFEGEIIIPAQKIMQWQLKLIRKNKNAIIALGGTII